MSRGPPQSSAPVDGVSPTGARRELPSISRLRAGARLDGDQSDSRQVGPAPERILGRAWPARSTVGGCARRDNASTVAHVDANNVGFRSSWLRTAHGRSATVKSGRRLPDRRRAQNDPFPTSTTIGSSRSRANRRLAVPFGPRPSAAARDDGDVHLLPRARHRSVYG